MFSKAELGEYFEMSAKLLEVGTPSGQTHVDNSPAESLASAADPLVTVAIPTYNRIEWLKDCIYSVLAQSYRNFEIVVSDNASTDGTSAFLTTLSDPRLRIVRQDSNIGLLPNWNACLKAARGRYIVFVSDDDRIEPRFLERCIDLIRLDHSLPVVIGLNSTYFAHEGEKSITGSGTLVPEYAGNVLETGIWNGTDILIEYLKQRIGVQMCTILMRTEAIRAQGGFPLDFPYAADVVTWAPLLLTGKSGFVKECCGTFVAHPQSQSSKHTLDIRLKEHKTAINLISTAAERRVQDPDKRNKIKMEATRNIANDAIDRFVGVREQGGSASDLLHLTRRYHRDIAGGDVSKFLMLIQYFLLPTSMAIRLRHFFQSARTTAAGLPTLRWIYRKLKRRH